MVGCKRGEDSVSKAEKITKGEQREREVKRKSSERRSGKKLKKFNIKITPVMIN